MPQFVVLLKCYLSPTYMACPGNTEVVPFTHNPKDSHHLHLDRDKVSKKTNLHYSFILHFYI